MPSFKPKTAKKIKVCKRYSTTLDGKHKEFMNDFSKDEYDIIPKLKEERYELKLQLENNNYAIEKVMEIKDRIREINETIKDLKGKKNNYFLDNSKYIFEYFENKKNIDNAENNKDSNTNYSGVALNSSNSSKSQALFNFFKIQCVEPDQNGTENKNKNIVQKYLCNIDESFLDMNAFVRVTDICQSCYKGELIPLDDEGVLICNECAVSVPYLIENEKPSYKEPPKEVCFYAYKKINHFKEILAQFQGKETTQIPDDVIEPVSYTHLTLPTKRIV